MCGSDYIVSLEMKPVGETLLSGGSRNGDRRRVSHVVDSPTGRVAGRITAIDRVALSVDQDEVRDLDFRERQPISVEFSLALQFSSSMTAQQVPTG